MKTKRVQRGVKMTQAQAITLRASLNGLVGAIGGALAERGRGEEDLRRRRRTAHPQEEPKAKRPQMIPAQVEAH